MGIPIVQMKLRALGEVACPGKWQGLDLLPGSQTPELMLSNLGSRRQEEDVKTPGGI